MPEERQKYFIQLIMKNGAAIQGDTFLSPEEIVAIVSVPASDFTFLDCVNEVDSPVKLYFRGADVVAYLCGVKGRVIAPRPQIVSPVPRVQ